MRVTTSDLFRQGLAALQRAQVAIAQTQRQIATGRRILTPADDPAGSKQVLDLSQAVGLSQQYQRNADAATRRLALEDDVLGAVTNLLQRSRELAIQGNSSVLSDGDRQALAQEVNQRLQELLGLANTKDGNGEYLFSGNKTQTRPFALGAGGVIYSGDQGTRRLQLSPDYQVSVGDAGSAVFLTVKNGDGTLVADTNVGNAGNGIITAPSVADVASFVADTYTISFPSATTFEVTDSGGTVVASGAYASGDVISFRGIETAVSGAPGVGDTFTVKPSEQQDLFATVANLIQTLRSGGQGAVSQAVRVNGINRFLLDVDQALENLRQVRTSIGARLNAVESEQEVNADFEVFLVESLSKVRDVDMAEAISRLNLQLTGLQAAQQSFLRIQNLSLFALL